MPRFTYDDIVIVRSKAPIAERRGQRAWVVGVLDDGARYLVKKFPPGVIYAIKFEDGSDIDVHEENLELAPQ